MSNTNIDIRSLPPTIRIIVNAVGLAQAAAILNEWGGQVLYLPDPAKPGQRAVEVFGVALTKSLLEHHKSQHFQVPKVDKITEHLRNAEILKDLESGMTFSAAVKKYKLTRQQLYNIRRDFNADFGGQDARAKDSQMGFTF